jgi:hypothetical protein
MKNIKKIAVLSAAIGAMAAFAMPSMASAAVWGPLNTNQTLTGSQAVYTTTDRVWDWQCDLQLGTHVRTPASSTLDVTSASWSRCQGRGNFPCTGISMAPVGLPWTAVATSSTTAKFTMHGLVTMGGLCGGETADVQGTVTGTWNPTTHKFGFSYVYGFVMSHMGAFIGNMTFLSEWTNVAQTLTLT